MDVAVLGPVQARLGGGDGGVDLGTPKQRALVAALALSGGRPVAVDTIVDLLWGDAAPAGVAGTLQAYVSGLRRVLEPDRERRAPAAVLVTVAPGYALRLTPGALDASRFEQVVDEEHRRVQLLSGDGPAVLSGDELTDAVARLDAALALWRGTPYGELGDADAAVAERSRLEELRLVALEDRAVAGLALGHHGTVAADLEALTAAHPLRERLWALRALALTRSGRQADALQVLREVRGLLDEELGIEPGQELRDLQTAVLRQDPSLDWVAPPRRPGAPVVPLRPRAEPPAPGAGPGWPMLGRDADLVALEQAWDLAASGTTTYAVLTGEPGIGKSRLAAELAGVALQDGARVCIGRCLQDEGAPPLWPWSQVLEGIGAELPVTEDDDDDAVQFAAFSRIVGSIRDAAREQPVLLALDDLHWADPCSLRVLRLLAETATDDRLLVVATWRDNSEPTGALADVAELFARRHAVRRALTGLPADAVAEVFATVAHNRPNEEQAAALHERTDGNPFFVVEYARLAGERADLGRLLTEERPPAGVQDVLVRRLARLPDDTVATLRTAAVIGRRFDGPTLARATGIDEDGLLDVVEPAEAAGLVRDVGVEQFTFAHALVRDTLVAGLTATRRARVHARVAEALEDLPERAGERAQHWQAAGPSYVGRAWRSAVEAAGVSRRRYAHEQSAYLLSNALVTMREDPAATPRDRYDVLMHLVDAYRWSAKWPELVGTVEEAVRVAREELGDVELTARAAIATSQGALWQSAPTGSVHEQVVGALRWSLEHHAEESAMRCRILLALANELLHGASLGDRRVLVDEALGIARRLGDEALLLDACQVAFSSLWWAGTAPERLELADESLALARSLGQERAYVVSACLRAVVLGELGRPAEMVEASVHARAEAERLRIPYGLLVIDNLLLPWLAMAGRFEECQEALERIEALEAQIALDPSESAVAGASVVLGMWRDDGGQGAAILESMEGGPVPVTATVVAALWRAGRTDAARAHRATHEIRLEGEDTFAILNWAMAAEVALHLEEPALGASVRSLLLPFAGRSCSVGSGFASGPVDLYLALAAAAAGERAPAKAHADDAERLCAEWEIPLAAQWLSDQRDRYGF